MKASFKKIKQFFRKNYDALSRWLAQEDGLVAWVYYHIWHLGLSGVGKYYVFFTVAIVVYLLWAGGHSVFSGSIDLVGALFERKTDGSLPALDSEDYENYRNLMLGLAGLAALPFFLIRMWVEERKTKTAEQGHMTDRINKAVEALGAEKTSKNLDEKTGEVREFTEPNLEVRIGAILALERISQDSQRDHWPVMEILTAYLKNNTSLEKNPLPVELANLPDIDKHNNRSYSSKLVNYMQKFPDPRSDIQLIMTVLGRRSWTDRAISYFKEQVLDLRYLNLCKVNLIGAKFLAAEFSCSCLIGSYLNHTNLNYADLSGTNLACSKLNNTNLSFTNLTAANLSHVNLTYIDQEFVNFDLSFGDIGTLLSDGIKRPEHWNLQMLEQNVVVAELLLKKHS